MTVKNLAPYQFNGNTSPECYYHIWCWLLVRHRILPFLICKISFRLSGVDVEFYSIFLSFYQYDMGSIPGLERSPQWGHGTHSSILAWRIPMGRRIQGGHKKSDTTGRLSTAQYYLTVFLLFSVEVVLIWILFPILVYSYISESISTLLCHIFLTLLDCMYRHIQSYSPNRLILHHGLQMRYIIWMNRK